MAAPGLHGQVFPSWPPRSTTAAANVQPCWVNCWCWWWRRWLATCPRRGWPRCWLEYNLCRAIMLTTCWLFPTDASSNRSRFRVDHRAHFDVCGIQRTSVSLIKSGRRWVRVGVGEGCFSVEASRRENRSQIGPLGFPCFDEACH